MGVQKSTQSPWRTHFLGERTRRLLSGLLELVVRDSRYTLDTGQY
jgi:hypothetical protein